MRVLSVCSGIAADAVAWHPLGWQTVAFAETNAHASAVLAHHYPEVPNLGDFTRIQPDDVGAVDLIASGTPCQSFSVAGLRGGMDDNRGNLALEFCQLVGRLGPRWVVWENVPGVLSADGGRAFRSVIEGLWECGYATCWRILDAQYVRVESHPRAVPQRRRRVFVVGHLGADWRPPVAVLLEPESLRGGPAPRRTAGEGTAGSLSSRATAGGGLGTDFECGGGLIAPPLTHNPYGDHESREGLLLAFGGNRTSGPRDVATALSAHGGPHGRLDFESETFVTHTLRAEGHDASEDGTGRGTPIVADTGIAVRTNQTSMQGPPWMDGVCFGISSAESPPAVAFQSKASEHNSMNPSDVAPSIDVGKADGISVLEVRGRGDGRNLETRADGTANAVRTPGGGRDGMGVGAIHSGMTVRRITPKEAERLQGLPDDYTLVSFRGKPMANGPRYRLLGNSIAVNCLSWIGQRIALWEEVTRRSPNLFGDR